MAKPETSASASGEASSEPKSGKAAFASVRAVVNPMSGSVDAGAADALRAMLAERGLQGEVAEVGAGDLEALLKAAIDAKPDLLILLAGDGTARLAAALCGPDGPLLAALPGGTMNMLPHALYGPVSWREALAQALDSGVERKVSGGEVDGRRFFVAAILGAPALWAPAREAVRKGKLKLAFLRSQRALKRAFAGRLRFSLDDGLHQKAEALTLMCPLISKALTRTDALEALAINPKGAAEAVRLGARTLLTDVLGDWREDPSVQVAICRQGRAWSRGHIPAILDGEPHRLSPDSKIAFVPTAFRALALDTEAPQPVAEHEKRKSEAGAATAAVLSKAAR